MSRQSINQPYSVKLFFKKKSIDIINNEVKYIFLFYNQNNPMINDKKKKEQLIRYSYHL